MHSQSATERSIQACGHAAVLQQPKCRLELMGLPTTLAYQKAAHGVLRQGRSLFSGLNIPNKKRGEPLLEWAEVIQQESTGFDLCVHYSLKHQRRRGASIVESFSRFCSDAAALGVTRVLLVTGPRGPSFDTVRVLQELSGSHLAEGWIRIGVAFNACLPSEAAREAERSRLVQKLQSGLVQDVWLNTGDDVELLAKGACFVNSIAVEYGQPLSIFGSALLPNEAQLNQFRERPWNGVHFSERYLSSIEGMSECTRDVLSTFLTHAVEPLIESKVRSSADLRTLEELLKSSTLSVAGSNQPPLKSRLSRRRDREVH